MIIRSEKPEDIQEIRNINIAAFDTEFEANLVDALRKSDISLISLVAEINGKLVGHILFSPVTLKENKPCDFIAGLAPMAVLPEYQRKGIGAKLIEEGLKQCKEAGYEAVIVLGHPNYYPKFGFVPSVNFGIRSEYNVPDEAFMAQELKRGALANFSGTVKYHELFNSE